MHFYHGYSAGWRSRSKRGVPATYREREIDVGSPAGWLAVRPLFLSLSPSLRPHFPPSTARACCVPFCAIVTPFLRWPTLRGCLAAIRGVESRGERKRNESNRGETKTIVRLPSRAPPSTLFTGTHRTSCMCIRAERSVAKRKRGTRKSSAAKRDRRCVRARGPWTLDSESIRSRCPDLVFLAAISVAERIIEVND